MELFVYLLTVTFLIKTAMPDDQLLGCDEGWTSANGYCYAFVTDKKVTWSQAQQECDRFDSSLLYFDTQDEITWFTSLSRNYSSAAYWTSLNDNSWAGSMPQGTGQWKWGRYQYVDPTVIQWNTSPTNDGLSNCGGINIQGNMTDVDCASRQGFICNTEKGPGVNCSSAPGWVQTPTDCYYVSNTSDVSQLITWDQAKTQCTTIAAGGHLLTIDDINDQTFIQNRLPYIATLTYLFWTGLTSTSSGKWQWHNGATFNQQYFQWTTEPDNLAGKENCAVVRPNGKFSDRDCNMLQNYVCKLNQIKSDKILKLGCDIWTRAGQMCYMFYSNPPLTWTDARAQCMKFKGDLISVKDMDTHMWLSQQMLVSENDASYWIGLNDRDNEGQYVWADGTSLDPNTISWLQQPNDYKGQEDCAVIMPFEQGFDDTSCSYHSAPLCELDDVSQCPSNGQWISRTSDNGNGYNCYLFGSYANRSLLLSKSEAATFCSGLAVSGSQVPKLLSIDTSDEKNFIYAQLNGFKNNSAGFWTSLNDVGSEGYWLWDGDTVDPSLVDWLTEPSQASPELDCVRVMFNGYYATTTCNLKLRYICGRKAHLTITTTSGKQGMKAKVTLLISFVIVSMLVL